MLPTAVIYLIIRFREGFLNFIILNYLLTISCLTMFISGGINAIFETDLMKIMASYILSQRNFMFIFVFSLS